MRLDQHLYPWFLASYRMFLGERCGNQLFYVLQK